MSEAEALLQQLRDIQPPPVSLWPAPGWWLLLAVMLSMAGMLWWLLQYRRSHNWSREAMQELDRLRASAAQQTAGKTLSDISRLLRRVMLAVRPREDIASLHGPQWIQALDQAAGRSSSQSLFDPQIVDWIETGPYRPDVSLQHKDFDAIFSTVETFIQSVARRNGRR